MNATHNKMTHEYNDSIELEYNKLTSSLPQYKDEFENENAAWKEYQDCVWEVALCDPDHGLYPAPGLFRQGPIGIPWFRRRVGQA